MDFGVSADERAFADEVRAFPRAHPLETFPEGGPDAGYGSGPPPPAFPRPRGHPGCRRGRWEACESGPEP